MTFRPPVILTT